MGALNCPRSTSIYVDGHILEQAQIAAHTEETNELTPPPTVGVATTITSDPTKMSDLPFPVGYVI